MNSHRGNPFPRTALIRGFWSFARDRRGNIAMMTALMLPVVVLSTGAALDYITAARREGKINGIADAAALAAVTPTMMQQSQSTAQTTAYALFNSQAATVTDVGTITPNVQIGEVSSGTNIIRTATVTYTSTSNNVFAGVLGFANMPIRGKAVAKSSFAPKTNFYMLIDTSPSMEIPATTNGINAMVAATSAQGGCAFACHETHPDATDTAGNPGGVDNYTLERSLRDASNRPYPLRIDLVNSAVQALMVTAPATATANNTVYGVALYTIDENLNQLYPVNPSNPVLGPSPITPTQLPPNSNFAAAQSAAGTITPMTIWVNNRDAQNIANNDEDSWLDLALQRMNAIMPAPGNGTSAPTDTPQEVLLIVSDALPDETYGGARYYGPVNTHGNDWCSSIKNNHIRIAFLYLTYNPLPPTAGNQWYTSHIAPIQNSIAPAAQACASPGLFTQVDTDGDITSALQNLFQRAVATAYLSQ